MEIERYRYLRRLIARKHNGMVKIVTGVRGCGKSYLLFNLFREHLKQSGVDDAHMISIALDSRENEDCRDVDSTIGYCRWLPTILCTTSSWMRYSSSKASRR